MGAPLPAPPESSTSFKNSLRFIELLSSQARRPRCRKWPHPHWQARPRGDLEAAWLGIGFGLFHEVAVVDKDLAFLPASNTDLHALAEQWPLQTMQTL